MDRLATSPKFIFNQRADNGGRQQHGNNDAENEGLHHFTPSGLLQGLDIFHVAVVHRVPLLQPLLHLRLRSRIRRMRLMHRLCKEILLCVLAHAIDEHTVAEYRLVWSVSVQTGTLKSLGYHVVSQVADRCAPAEEAARVAVS
jgi:hypothetical protein